MITTIDKAGRVVIPKEFRQKFHLNSRTQIEIIPDGDALRLRVPSEQMTLREKDGVWVQSSESPCDLDSTEFINQLREARSQDVLPLSHN